ncbi:hypothetical protein Btru_024276 [Bulinus truncatus]|nr:hypothetical protein Btru_024276 [Bulinus truncatus]
MKEFIDKLLIFQLVLLAVYTSYNQINAQRADVLFVLDVTTPSDELDNNTVNIIQDIVSALDIGQGPGQTRISAVTYNNGEIRTAVRFNSTVSNESLPDTIHKTGHSTGIRNQRRSLQKIIKYMFESRNGGRPDAPHVIVVIANSQSGHFSSVVKDAANAMQEDAVVYTVTIGGDVENIDLLEAATNPEFYFVLNITDSDDFITTKSDMIKEITEACSRYYMDVTIAYDALPMSPQQEDNRKQQLERIKENLHHSECHTRIRVIFGSGQDSPTLEGNSITQEHRRPRVSTVLRKWRNGKLTRQKRTSEGGPGSLPPPGVDAGKRLILVMSSRHESEFKKIVSELRQSLSRGTDVLLVLDETVKPNYVLTWQQLLGFSRVIVPNDHTQDISTDVVRFICHM